ncbi:MAG TPA: diadenylate cyclase CdaA [Candidatus Binatia bacterium]|nr:diadenylate cyclase CdaA [Candidatus Binatia bacterium]
MPGTTISWAVLARLDWRAVLDILLVAALIYYLLRLARGTRAAQIGLTIVVLLVLHRAARFARLEMTDWLLSTALSYFVLALLILFQPEIRNALARAGRNSLWKRLVARNRSEVYDDVVLAVRHCAQHRIGALMVIERQAGLRTYMESGIPLDATVSYDLLLSIFSPGSPLHDGAVILSGDRVAAAACFLPLTLSPEISNQLGTRHRAAVGVTEESDAVAVVVSEQTGAIALAMEGNLEQNLTPDQLAERLGTLVTGGHKAPVAAPGVTVGG